MGEMTELEPQPRRLYRSRKDRKIAGVLGGFAEYFGLDPAFVRVLYVIATAITAFVPLTFLYVMMVFIIPVRPKVRV
jgi:phage shock protein PspC (stress-responsive transcriptional regulator)